MTATREKLPDRRRSVTQRVRVNGQTVHFTVGLYPDGRPGEVFIDVAKDGTAARSWAGATAKLMSLMLQYGVPLHELAGALIGSGEGAFGQVSVEGHDRITESTGVLDTVVRSLALDYLAAELAAELLEDDADEASDTADV